MIERDVPKPAFEVRVSSKSPLEEALEKKQKLDTLKQKYNLKDRKNMKMPTMVFEGEDRS